MNFIKLYKNKTEDREADTNLIDKNTEKKEKSKMEKIIKVEGMMCPHCEATVKKALEDIDGITAAYPSHEKNEVKIEFSKEVSEDVIKKTITDKGYTVE